MSRFHVRVVGGGSSDAASMAAVVEAVTRVLTARDRADAVARPSKSSGWARAGRLDTARSTAIRSRSELASG